MSAISRRFRCRSGCDSAASGQRKTYRPSGVAGGVSQFLSQRRAKHQAPTPKLQRNPGIETPKTKLQTPKKSQVPSSKPRPALRAWSLELLWSLELGVWCLGLGASLELGVWNLELFA